MTGKKLLNNPQPTLAYVKMHFVVGLYFLLNLPWTCLGFMCALISVPTRLHFSSRPLAIIFHVKSFWWKTWLPSKKGTRAMAQGNIVLLSPTILPGDIEHELIHVQQFQKRPLIQPFLYLYQNLRYGYRNNKYEKEAYKKSGSRFIEQ